MVIPDHDISPVSSFNHMMYNVDDPVLTIIFQISLGAFAMSKSRRYRLR